MQANVVGMLLAAAALLQVAAAQGPVITWLKNNKDTTTAAAILQQLYPNPISEKAKFTILVPTDSAIEAFRRDMGLTPAQFKERTGLLDLVVAYHIIPGYQAKELKVSKQPAVAVTGDINYVLRFWNTPKGVTVEDLQGNNVTLSKPVDLGNAAVIVIDKVLMSGSYFFDGKKALSYYPQWLKAKEFAEAVGYPEGTGKEQDMTFLVPDNKAMENAGDKTKAMSAADKKNLFLYHLSQPARSAPTDFKNGDVIKTNFQGHTISVSTSVDTSKVDVVTGKPNAVPTMIFMSETGNKANTRIYNVFVGRSIWQGIDAVLIPNLGTAGDNSGPKVQTESGNKGNSVNSANSGNKAESGSKGTSGATKNRRMLLAFVDVVRSAAGRVLKRYGGDMGSTQMYANTVSQQNTARAIDAAASGNIPASYATRYGSYNAKQAATWGECFNCNAW